MQKKHYIFIAVFSYLLFLLTTIPISTITGIINNNTAVTLQGASGTIWRGQASNIAIKNGVNLKDTQWSFNAWKLFIGQISYQIQTRYKQQDITGEFSSSFLQRYSVNQLSAKISAENIASLANIPLVQLSGLIALEIDHAHWKKGELPSANGEIVWRNAAVTVAETASLGNVTIQLSETENYPLQANISNTGGDISLGGDAQLIPEKNYSANIELTPTAQANANIKNSLTLFAKRQANGSYLLKKTGQLNQLGL